MLITKVTDEKQIELIVQLANNIWHEYFTPIIGSAQVDYMLQKFQSQQSISEQIQNGVRYFLLSHDRQPIGYVGIILKDYELFLSKFYILSSERNKGFGHQVIAFLEQFAVKQDINNITLTVNKNNSAAIKAYQKMGFVNIGSTIKDIGNSFVMDDYKMKKEL